MYFLLLNSYKKSLLTIALFTTIYAVSNAQLGIRAGLNLASFSQEQSGVSLNTDSKIGFQFGITNDFKLSDNITFRPGLLYSIKGGTLNIELPGFEETFESSFNYLDIPLSLIYNFKGEDSGFFGEVGPYLGFLLSANSEGEDIKESLNTLDFGINIGLGYDFGKFVLGANYGFGLANITKEEAGDEATTRNKNIAIYGIYQF